MRLIALLLLPWLVLSVWIGPVLYLMGLTIDALIVLTLPILIGLTVNLRTVVRIFREGAVSQDHFQSHQVQRQRQSLANLNRRPL